MTVQENFGGEAVQELNVGSQDLPEHEFDGQQEGERVLYIIQLHRVKKLINMVQGILLAILFYALASLIPNFVPVNELHFSVGAGIVALLLFVARIWWGEIYCEHTRTILTDRRIIRFEFALPFFKKKRSLFWKEVSKVKTTAPSILFGLSKIGALTIQPLMVPGEEIHIPYVYYFVDLANYIEKIVYTERTKPEDLATMRPFVPKPKGKRY